jgi:putative transposase
LKHDLIYALIRFAKTETKTREVMMKSKVVGKKKVINGATKAAMFEIEKEPGREARLAMIQMLIPLGLKAVEAELQAEVGELCGTRYSRGGAVGRWGSNEGSVFLGEQKVSIKVPRVRDQELNEEVPLKSYERLQSTGFIDEMVLSRVINGISQGKYERAVSEVPETFGIKKTSVCRKFIKASAARLREFLERDLSAHDIVAIFMDGKYFAENQMVIALGVTMSGEKIILGFVETSTENHAVCRDFINRLKERGLNVAQEILFIIDGGKGLFKAVKQAMGKQAIVQRCQWHKRENVLSYLGEEKKVEFRRRLQSAYEQSTYEKAKKKMLAIKKELGLINQSAVASLDEGLEETLTLHRLGLFEKLGRSFKTTNCIENVNKQLAVYTDRVTRWQNSDQRQRWVATAILELEPGLRTVMGHNHLKDLRAAMKAINSESINQQVA